MCVCVCVCVCVDSDKIRSQHILFPMNFWACKYEQSIQMDFYFTARPFDEKFWCLDYFQFSSVAQSCLTVCDPMNRSTPDLPVHHQLLEFTQTHVHWVGDAIQPSHPRSSLSSTAPTPPSIRVFSSESTLRMRWLKYWSFSFSIIPSKEHPAMNS